MPYYSAIQYPMYKPAVRDIVAITQSNPAIITTSFPHTYLTGLIVRLNIPQDYGIKVGRFKGTITVLSPTTFSIPLNASVLDPFVIPVEAPNQPELNVAQVIPVGEETAILTQSFVNVLTPQF
jgi:hypothetical protein